ncbi:MAG: sigma-54 dependent transcriptional regulator [Gemmatimonadota bacterium]|nr:sigma-54 dependent transcriptional regulator [Gemmatimonadota bacterium]
MAAPILIVDDDERIRTSLSEALERDGWTVRTAASGESALSQVAEVLPAVVLADVRMKGMSGLELLRLLRERAPEIDVVIMTAHQDLPTVGAAMREGAVEFLVKPLELSELRRLLSRVRDDRELRGIRPGSRPTDSSEVEASRATTVELVGHHPLMIEVFKLAGQVASSTSTVLIRGESGTGKELVARWIHDNSPRAAEPFVAVNCTALPGSLLETELFGHVRGAFTGAVADRRGRFALARRGTLLLDEIGDTSVDFQAKLLRVLEDGVFQPVGAERAERTDARVLAATHRDLEALVEEGAFRKDLYYRLRVVEIQIPPLRERRDDVPAIVDHLVHRSALELGRPVPAVAEDAMGALVAREWPGNVRELKNCLERAVLMAAGGVIRPEHVEGLRDGTPPGSPVGEEAAPGRLRPLDAAESAHVAHVLRATRGNKSRAAEILEISRPRLDRLIKKHDLGHLAPGRRD